MKLDSLILFLLFGRQIRRVRRWCVSKNDTFNVKYCQYSGFL